MKCPYCAAAQGRSTTTSAGRSITECISCGRVVEERQTQSHHLFHIRAQDSPLCLVTSDLPTLPHSITDQSITTAVPASDEEEDPFEPTGFITAFSTWSLEPYPVFAQSSLSFAGHLAELERALETTSSSSASGPSVVVDNLRAYLQIIDVASILGLDCDISDHAFQLFRDCSSATCLRNRSVEALATAALVQAIREAQEPRTLQEISIAANLPQKEIGKYIKILGEALQLSQPLNSNSISVHMPRFCTLLQLNKSAQELATHIGEVVINKCFCTRRNPISISAAAIYLASQLEDKRKTQAEICKVTGLTEVTLRKVYKELLENWDDLLPSNYTPAIPPEKAFPSATIATGRSASTPRIGDGVETEIKLVEGRDNTNIEPWRFQSQTVTNTQEMDVDGGGNKCIWPSSLVSSSHANARSSQNPEVLSGIGDLNRHGGSSSVAEKVEKAWDGPQVTSQASKGTTFGTTSAPVGSFKTRGKTMAAKAKSPLKNVERKTAPETEKSPLKSKETAAPGADSSVRARSPIRVPSPVRVQSPIAEDVFTGLADLGSKPASPPPVRTNVGASSSRKASLHWPMWSISEDDDFSDLRTCYEFVDRAVPLAEREAVAHIPEEEKIPRMVLDLSNHFSIAARTIKEYSVLKHQQADFDKKLDAAKKAERWAAEKDVKERLVLADADKKKLESQVEELSSSLSFAQQELALEKPKVESLIGKLKAEAEKNARLERELAFLTAQAEQSARLEAELAAVKAEAEKGARLAEELAAAKAEAEKGVRLESELAASKLETAALAKEKPGLEEQLDVQKRLIIKTRATLSDSEAHLQKERKGFMKECMPKVVLSCLRSPQLMQAVENLNLTARQAGIADTLKGKIQRTKVNFALERADTVFKQRQEEFNNLVFPPLVVLSALADQPDGIADLKAVLAEIEE